MQNVMNEIEKQTGFHSLYTNGIDTTRPVSIRVDSRPLDETLAQLFRNMDIACKITVPNIVLSKRPASTCSLSVSGVVKDASFYDPGFEVQRRVCRRAAGCRG